MYPQQYPALESTPAAGYNSLSSTNDDRMRKFQYLVDRYEINREFATRLRALEGYEIVFIVDGENHFVLHLVLTVESLGLDSGSMNTPLGDISGPFDRNPTRWDELRQTVSIVVDIASVYVRMLLHCPSMRFSSSDSTRMVLVRDRNALGKIRVLCFRRFLSQSRTCT